MPVTIEQCRGCGHRMYPARLWCPACGHDEMRPLTVESAELVAWTAMPARAGEPCVILATARAMPDGPTLVARLEELPARAGQVLCLFEKTEQGRALPWARLPRK